MRMRKMELLVLFLATALIAGTAGAQDITTGLQGHWALDEGEGTTAYDSSPNGYDGTFMGVPTWQDGPDGFGGALQFHVTGSADGVDCGTECNPGSTFTVAVWAYWDGNPGVGTQHFLTKGGYDDMWQWEVWEGHSSNTYKDRVGMSYRYAPGGSVPFCLMPVAEWTHLAFTFDVTCTRIGSTGVI